MTPRAKQTVSVLLTIALVALLLLSVSLSDVQFQPGSPFPGGAANSAPAQAGPTASSPRASVTALELIVGVLFLVLMVYLPTRLSGLLSPRNLIRIAIGFLLLLALLSVLPRMLPGLIISESGGTVAPTAAPSIAYAVSPLGEPPAAFTWLAAASALLGAALLLFLLFRRASKPAVVAEALGQEAEKALGDLQAGANFPDVIIRCYAQMTEILRAEQKLERRESMTAREFQDWLESRGIPAAPVQSLTALFEKVRYGASQIDKLDETTGVGCLTEIAQYCRGESVASQ